MGGGQAGDVWEGRRGQGEAGEDRRQGLRGGRDQEGHLSGLMRRAAPPTSGRPTGGGKAEVCWLAFSLAPQEVLCSRGRPIVYLSDGGGGGGKKKKKKKKKKKS